jgi:cytochrome P450
MKSAKTTALLAALLAVLLVVNWDDVWINTVVVLTLNRGIISQNCFWWSLNDMFPDSTGAGLYANLKERGRFVPLNVLGKEIYLVTDLDDIMQLLQGSPNPFGPGILKKNFFDSFMPNNVGISVNPEWKLRREYNDGVLEPNKTHTFHEAFNESIQEAFATQIPKTFSEFTELTRRLTSKIVFGTYEYNPVIYRVFKQADSILSARFNTHPVDSGDLKEFRAYMRDQLESPQPNTLMSLAFRHHDKIPMDAVIDQIPHWIFPIAGLFSVHLPRLMVLLSNHPKDLAEVVAEIKDQGYMNSENYCRKCILELFRLNNAVNSTFRGLTEPFQFKGDATVFQPGTQFVFFNNPILRDLFDHPNEFVPSRWTQKLEASHQALMFNHGNQTCPGKELVITLLTLGLVNYLQVNEYTVSTPIKLNPSSIPYMLNPCTIVFD